MIYSAKTVPSVPAKPAARQRPYFKAIPPHHGYMQPTYLSHMIEAYPRFLNAAAKLVDATTAEDIAQSTIARLLRPGIKLNRDEDIVPYGIITARRIAIDELKRRGRLAPVDPNLRAPGFSILNHLICRQALDSVTPAEKHALESRYINGNTSAEIAHEAGVNVGLINVRLSRGRKHARKHWPERSRRKRSGAFD